MKTCFIVINFLSIVTNIYYFDKSFSNFFIILLPTLLFKFKDTKFICACGETFTLKSNKDEMHIDVCSKCHPAYTGKQNATTVKGNVDKFNKKYGIKKA